jgi:hypothetical protein
VGDKSVYSFIPASSVPKDRPKPVIAALKIAELAAKKVCVFVFDFRKRKNENGN